jgi:hypothetical protein
MLQISPRSMTPSMTARPAYHVHSRPSSPERWSRRRTFAFIVLTNATIWGMLAWSVAAMAQR